MQQLERKIISFNKRPGNKGLLKIKKNLSLSLSLALSLTTNMPSMSDSPHSFLCHIFTHNNTYLWFPGRI